MNLLILVLLTLILASGCFENKALKVTQTSQSSSSQTLDCENCEENPSPTAEPTPAPTAEPTPEPPEDVNVVDYRRSHGVMKQSQVLSSFKKCLDIENLSERTLNTYRDVRTNLPRFGKVEEVSSPYMMSLLQLVSEICVDLIDQEANARHYFKGFSINGQDNSVPASIPYTVGELAKSCWGRPARTEEIQLIQQGFEASAFNAVYNRRSALFLCTATLSTFQSVRF